MVRCMRETESHCESTPHFVLLCTFMNNNVEGVVAIWTLSSCLFLLPKTNPFFIGKAGKKPYTVARF
jgi:hypothetical protein